MEYAFIAVIFIQTILLVYMDIANRKERERLQLQLMSKTVKEYVEAKKDIEAPKNPEVSEDEDTKEEDEYLELDEASSDKLLNAKDEL